MIEFLCGFRSSSAPRVSSSAVRGAERPPSLPLETWPPISHDHGDGGVGLVAEKRAKNAERQSAIDKPRRTRSASPIVLARFAALRRYTRRFSGIKFSRLKYQFVRGLMQRMLSLSLYLCLGRAPMCVRVCPFACSLLEQER